MSTFHEYMKQFEITYMIYSGTLVGSFRQHDILAWDDDIDVFVANSSRALLSSVLSDIEGYSLSRLSNRWKFSSKASASIKNEYVRIYKYIYTYVGDLFII